MSVFFYLNYKVGMAVLENMEEGEEDARKLLQTEEKHPDTCVKEFVKRIDSCEKIQLACPMDVAMFGSNCLSYLDVPEKYCDDIPSRLDLVRGPLWANKKCSKFGSKDSKACGAHLFQALVDFCHPIAGLRERKDLQKKPLRITK